MTFPRQCPCCGYLSLPNRGHFAICEVCFWTDDGQDDLDADTVRGGPNGTLSLTEARVNFTVHGAFDPRHVGNVRPPNAKETHV